MAIYVWEISDMICKAGYRLIAGKEGLNQQVSGMAAAETIELLAFMEGQEIVYTTGSQLREEMDLLSFLREARAKQASGVLLTEGKYIKELPKAALRYCDQHGLPLYKVRWENQNPRKLSHVVSMIEQMDNREQELMDAFKGYIFSQAKKKQYYEIMERYQYTEQNSYAIGVIEDFQYNQETGEKKWKEHEFAKVQQYLKNKCPQCLAAEEEGIFLCLFTNYENQSARERMVELYHSIRTNDPAEHIYLGLGENVGSLDQLKESYRQAVYVTMLKKKDLLVKPTVRFGGIGVYTLLGAIENEEIIKQYYKHYLEPLVQYDGLHGTDYFRALQVLIEQDFHMSEAAGKLYLHRSSMNYKVSKIQSILNCNLKVMEDRLHLMEAYKIWQILYAKEQIPDLLRKDIERKIPMLRREERIKRISK